MRRRQQRDEQETMREVRRAELLLASAQQTSGEEAARTLRDHAAAAGISVHAAALAFVAAIATGSVQTVHGGRLGWA